MKQDEGSSFETQLKIEFLQITVVKNAWKNPCTGAFL